MGAAPGALLGVGPPRQHNAAVKQEYLWGALQHLCCLEGTIVREFGVPPEPLAGGGGGSGERGGG